MGEEQTLMTVRELAEYLSVSRSLIYKWIARKRVPCFRLGKGDNGAIRFDKAQIDQWLETKDK